MNVLATKIAWLAATALTAAGGQAGDQRVLLWDTGKPLAVEGIESQLKAKAGWRLVPPGAPPAVEFQGHAVLENEHLQVLCGRGNGPPSVYSKKGVGGGARRMSLLPLNGKREPCAAIVSMNVVENSGEEAILELCSRSQEGALTRTRLALGPGAFAEVQPVENAAAIRACARSRFAVLPDFFGDDVVFDARQSAEEQLYLPAENLLLNFTGNGDTILMSVWPPGDQDVQALLGGESRDRWFEAAEITCDNKSVYFAVLDHPGIWHSLSLEDPSCSGRDVATGWKKPFDARWRADFRLADRTDSWEFEPQRRDAVVVPSFGQIVWPFWFHQGEAMVRLVRPDYLGVTLIFPLERRQNTPLPVFTPVDILRETLGTGPCEYILDREGLATRTPGGGRRLVCTGVCNTTGRMQHFFERGLECKEMKILQDMAEDVKVFNITVRQRLEEYRAFARQLAELCREEQRREPAIGPLAARAARLEARLDQLFQERASAMRTPEENVALVEQLKELTRCGSPENLGKYLSLAAQLRALASAQDTLAALCRYEVRLFRREVGVIAAGDRSLARFAETLRERSRHALRNKHYTEGL